MLPRSNVNISSLTDTIIGQNFVGHIIKQVDERSEEAGEDDPVLSISTIVPLSGHEWEKDLNTFCRKKCAELKGDMAAMEQFLEGRVLIGWSLPGFEIGYEFFKLAYHNCIYKFKFQV